MREISWNVFYLFANFISEFSIFLQPKQEKAGTKNLEENRVPFPKKAKIQQKQPKHNQWLAQICIKIMLIVVGQSLDRRQADIKLSFYYVAYGTERLFSFVD